jgi:putative polyhydroxyalkanoate system protein
MSSPVVVDLPHRLGKEEARNRIARNIGKLGDHIPGGAAEVRSDWTGDRMQLLVKAMGQEVRANIDVAETIVRLEVTLPAMLSFFGKQIEGLIRRQGAEMLEDKSGGRGGGA